MKSSEEKTTHNTEQVNHLTEPIKQMGRGLEIVEYSSEGGAYVFTEVQIKSIQDASDAVARGEFWTDEEAEKDLDEWFSREK